MYISDFLRQAEKKEAEAALERENAADLPRHKAKYYASQGLKQLDLDEKGKKRRGKFPGFRPDLKKRGDRSRGGIDWYRHREVVLRSLLLPFAAKLKESGRPILVMEDGAPAHTSKYNREVFEAWEIQKLLWPPKSPDLNAIEHAWAWIRRSLGKRG